LKEKYPEDNDRRNIANRSQKRLTAEAHTNPLMSETSESEGIPEALPIYIPECVWPGCDARTGNMFSFLGRWSTVVDRYSLASMFAKGHRPTTNDLFRSGTIGNQTGLDTPTASSATFPLHSHRVCNCFHLGLALTTAND
jgi:hypothetical protein